jgi:hypothetical protein
MSATTDPIVRIRGRRQASTLYRDVTNADQVMVEIVRVSGKVERLPHIIRHSPDGFEWGYSGSGPSDLAIAICVAVLGDEPGPSVCLAVRDVLISPIGTDRWELTAKRVREVARQRRAS